jgi:hypothetical protein
VLPIAAAIHEGPGKAQAVLVLTLDLAWLGRQFGVQAEGSRLRMGVVSSTGTVLVHHPDPDRMVGQDIAGTRFFQAILAQHGRGTAEQPGQDGAPRVYAFTRFAETSGGPLYLWVSEYRSDVTAAADRQFWQGIGMWLVLAAMSVAAAWFATTTGSCDRWSPSPRPRAA